MNSRVHISGLLELRSMLKNMPSSVSKNVVRAGLRKASKPLIASARSKVPRDSNTLAKSIGAMTGAQRADLKNISTSSKLSLMGDKYAIYVGPRTRGKYSGWYGHFVEFGTKNQAAQPYMRPAWDASKEKVENILTSEIGMALHRYLQRKAIKK